MFIPATVTAPETIKSAADRRSCPGPWHCFPAAFIVPAVTRNGLTQSRPLEVGESPREKPDQWGSPCRSGQRAASDLGRILSVIAGSCQLHQPVLGVPQARQERGGARRVVVVVGVVENGLPGLAPLDQGGGDLAIGGHEADTKWGAMGGKPAESVH